MRKLILFYMAFFCLHAMASGESVRGPFPHERMDAPDKAQATLGRFIYVGDVPKFAAEELEITVSKLALTSRVTGWVSQSLIDGYAQQMYLRWKNLDDAVADMALDVHPLVKITDLPKSSQPDHQAWAKIAAQYSAHSLEKSGLTIYRPKRNASNLLSEEESYKTLISRAFFKYLFETNISPDSVKNDAKLRDSLLNVTNSRRLFLKHLGHLFTKTSERPGYFGFLTFVYPIAATVEGPFDQPAEQITTMKLAESMEARWWSDKWEDEFGGFPFLLIEWSGVAFHGPISNYAPMDVWYLRRDYVSHGCHRMDGSDVLELRALLPYDLKKASEKIKVTILDHFDVTDWNRDGKLEAIDVKYYNIPSGVSVTKKKTEAEVIAPYLIQNQMHTFLKHNPYAKKFYDVEKDALINAPKYTVQEGKLLKSGTHAQVPLFHFDYRGNRILQYREEGIKLRGFDDTFGKYPPKYFQRY